MGLKIENVDATGVRGMLDDMPFNLEVSGNRWTAAVGSAGVPQWKASADIAPAGEPLPLGLNDIRQLAWWALSIYRNASRGGMAHA